MEEVLLVVTFTFMQGQETMLERKLVSRKSSSTCFHC